MRNEASGARRDWYALILAALLGITLVAASIALVTLLMDTHPMIRANADVLNAHSEMIHQLESQVASDTLRIDTLESEVASLTVALEARNEVADSKASVAQEVAHAPSPTPKRVSPVSAAPVTSQGASEQTIRDIAAQRGLTDKDTANLIEIARRESTVGANPKAYEQGRENVGLFQLSSDKGTHEQRADDTWATNAAIDYINERYGSIDGAIAHSNAKGWY